MPAWAQSDEALRSVARLLRAFHDAAASFVPPPDAVWKRGSSPNSGPVVCHNDLCPGNVVFREGEAFAFLDFDFAHPSDPLWDVAMAAWHWIPLTHPADRDPADRGLDVAARLRAFADSYGLSPSERMPIPELAELFNRRKHAAIGQDPREDWERQMSQRSLRSAEWLRKEEKSLRAALS